MNVYEVDPEASVSLFTKAARMGQVEAMVRLGYIFQTAPNPNPNNALQWYKKAVKAGNTAAISEIGTIYETGYRKQPNNYAEAIAWYERGITNNSLKSAEALTRLCASCEDPAFHNGERAVYFATALAKKDSGNPAYMDLLAAAYARNIDFPNAIRAAAQAVSLSSLEEVPGRRERKEKYERGIPYPAVASDVWILKAAEKENLWAVMQLAESNNDVLGGNYDPATARTWYEVAARNGDAEAFLQLGYMCFRGEGGDVDMKKAFWCFNESAKAKNQNAYGPVARMYVGGKGVNQDFERALEWYEEAGKAGLRINKEHDAVKWFLRTPGRPSPEELYKMAQALIRQAAETQAGKIRTYSQKTNEVALRFWLAAEQEHAEAMNEIADMYFYGKRYFVRQGEPDATTGGLNCNYTKALEYYQLLQRRGIECPEMAECQELALDELRKKRSRQPKTPVTKRAPDRRK